MKTTSSGTNNTYIRKATTYTGSTDKIDEMQCTVLFYFYAYTMHITLSGTAPGQWSNREWRRKPACSWSPCVGSSASPHILGYAPASAPTHKKPQPPTPPQTIPSRTVESTRDKRYRPHDSECALYPPIAPIAEGHFSMPPLEELGTTHETFPGNFVFCSSRSR